MTRKAQLDLIKSTMETALTIALPAASLDNFDIYDTGVITDSDDKVFTVYIVNDVDVVDSLTIRFLIACQLGNEIELGQEVEYHDVIFPKIRELITASLLEETEREKITGDPWPAHDGRGGAFIDYDLVFSSTLDDCDS